MTFINEFASKEDMKKHGIAELKKNFSVPKGWDGWTIDRERNIVLMLVAQGGGKEGPSNSKRFVLLRGGTPTFHDLSQDIDIEKETIEWTLLRLKEPNYPSADVKRKFYEIYADLKSALRAYAATGPYQSRSNDYKIVEFINF